VLQSVYPRLNATSIGGISLAGIIFTWVKKIKSNKDLFIFIFYSFSLLLSQNRASIISIIVIAIFNIIFNRDFIRYKIQLIYAGLILGIITLISNINNIFYLYLSKGQTLDLILSLSGRSLKWAYALDYITKQSFLENLFGLGAFAGVRFVVGPAAFYDSGGSIGTFTTDNLWIDTFIDNGIFGIILIFIFFIYLGNQIMSIDDNKLRWFNINLFIYFVIKSFFTASFFVHSNLIFFFMIFSAAGLINKKIKEKLILLN
tara:strand:- start:1331 stop:2107 length:777 start_codon:yes stop_codon:yes gene_type:complete